MIFAATQILAIWLAWNDALTDAAWSWPFRNVSEMYFQNKLPLSSTAHRHGAFSVVGVFIFAAICEMRLEAVCGDFKSLSFFLHLVAYGSTIAAGLLWYWLLFDLWYNKEIRQKWFYEGQSALTDRLLNKRLSKLKPFFCVILLIAINVFHYVCL